MNYPFIISLPHASYRIPEEVKRTFALSSEEIKETTDRGVFEIFGSLPVEKIIFAQWNRLLVDLNRNPSRRAPKGVVPHVDYHGRSIYRLGCIPMNGKYKDGSASITGHFTNALLNHLSTRTLRRYLIVIHSMGLVQWKPLILEREEMILS